MSAVPAVLVCDPGTAHLKIAGLTVLDRMVITAHRAGYAPIFVVSAEPLELKRANELGIVPTFTDQAPEVDGAMRINGSVLFEENITDAASAREAERKLWASLGSTADGLVDRYFNRPLGRILSKLLVHTSISPNAVSLVSILIGVASAPFFATGKFLLGALILQLSAIIDCVDGELARVLFKQSRLGKWLDLLGDQVVHFSVFGAIGVGVSRSHPEVPAIALGISAALGVLLCLPPLIRALRMPAAQRPPVLIRLIDATANRDFSVLLIALALLDRVDWFLWMAGIGIHVFWITLVLLSQGSPAKRAMSQSAA